MTTNSRIEQLRDDRKRIAAAKWNAVVYTNQIWQQGEDRKSERADTELQTAIDAFKQRRLKAIDGELRRLGDATP